MSDYPPRVRRPRLRPRVVLAGLFGLFVLALTLGWSRMAFQMDQEAAARRLLAESAAYMTARFERDGAFPDAQGRVTSEAQSYALLRAAWLGDRAAFDRAWAWTQANLIGERGLAAWLWADGAVVDGSPAADADSDIALALLIGGQRWGDEGLLAAGARMAGLIWEREVAQVGDGYYLAAGPWAVQAEQVVLNPSYFSPYAYRLFAEADPAHPWGALLDSGYRLIGRLTRESLAGERPAGLPPDWVALRRADGALLPARLGDHDTTGYSYDAPRLYWRVAVDLRLSGDPRAAEFLAGAGFIRGEVERSGGVQAVYSREGVTPYPGQSMVATAGALGVLVATDPARAAQLFTGQVAAANSEAGAAWWGDGSDLYAQEWGWFAAALFLGASPG